RNAAVQTPAGRAEDVSGGFVPGRADGGSNKPARLLEKRGDLFVGDLLLEGFAGGDEVEVSLVHQDLGGEVAGVVAAGHGEAVGAGAEEGQVFAFADFLEPALLGEAVAAFADGADDVGEEGGAAGVAMQRHDLVVAVIHGGAGEVVHGGVNH